MLGDNLTRLALCEVVPVKKFKEFGDIATLQDESALIVRFLFPISNFGYGNGCGCLGSSISECQMPTLGDVLRCLGKVNAASVKYQNAENSYNEMHRNVEKNQKRRKRKNRNRK